MKYLLLIVLALAGREATAQDTIKVSGYLLDTDYKPLGGAEVLVFAPEAGRQGRKAVDAQGYYEFEVTKGSPITLWYFHPIMGSVSIAKLSGKNKQDISKILPKDEKQAAKSAESVLEMIHSVEAFVLVSSQNEEFKNLWRDSEKATIARLQAVVENVENEREKRFLSARFAFLRQINRLDQ